MLDATPGGASPSADAFVRVRGVVKRFGGTTAVEDASFDLARGEFMTILGPSGSGKTTLLRMIAGFIEPTAGQVEVQGVPFKGVPPFERSIGMVFQRLALFPHMSAAGNVAYPLRMRGFARREIPRRIQRYLELVHLDGLENRRIHELSGGQQQRVAIARALVFEPDLLLLDEPLGSLDKQLRESMQLEFRRIQRELGVTTINVTHDQREALVMSDRLLVMHAGRIQQAASPAGAYRTPANRFVAGFIGVTNFIATRIRAVRDGTAELEAARATLRGRCALEHAEAAGMQADAAIRAEQIHIAAARGAADGLETLLDGVVAEVIFEGDRMVYAVDVAVLDARLRIFDYDVFNRPAKDVGEHVRVGWQSQDLMVFPKTIPSAEEETERHDGE